jgi:nucleoside transporter
MRPIVRLQLSVMMFLQYAIWGAWAVTMFPYLAAKGFKGVEIGWVYNTAQIGAILSPLLLGLIADRFFATQTLIAVCHLAGAGLLFAAADANDPRSVFLIMLVYNLFYMPTLALTNAISFRNMDDPDRQFPSVRVLGTIGWIAAGLVVGFLGIGSTNRILLLAGGLSATLGVFSVLLPHTPPVKSTAERPPGMLAALAMFKQPSFAVLMILSFGVSIVLAFYYQLTADYLIHLGRRMQERGDLSWAESLLSRALKEPAGLMTLGQISEIFFLLALPLIVTKLGVRWTLLIGMAAWCLRYGIFYSEWAWVVVAIALPLHGICYDFFFVVSQLYVDNRAPRELRASAQGLLTLITIGLGMFVGNILAGYSRDVNTTLESTGAPIPAPSLFEAFLPYFLWEPVSEIVGATSTHWPGVWAPAALGCGGAVVLFFLGFREPQKRRD